MDHLAPVKHVKINRLLEPGGQKLSQRSDRLAPRRLSSWSVSLGLPPGTRGAQVAHAYWGRTVLRKPSLTNRTRAGKDSWRSSWLSC
eukprot:717174-Prorocentrum_minimum.AAC.1